MRRNFHITKDNIDDYEEIWEVIKEVFADNEAEHLGGEDNAMMLLDIAVRNGYINIDANLDDDLASDDDDVRYILTKTAMGETEDLLMESLPEEEKQQLRELGGFH